jgi:hypothetical protein
MQLLTALTIGPAQTLGYPLVLVEMVAMKPAQNQDYQAHERSSQKNLQEQTLPAVNPRYHDVGDDHSDVRTEAGFHAGLTLRSPGAPLTPTTKSSPFDRTNDVRWPSRSLACKISAILLPPRPHTQTSAATPGFDVRQ